MNLGIETVSFDAHDTDALARFWEQLLGFHRTEDVDGEVQIEPPPGVIASPLIFVPVPDDKVGKNRLHLDLRPADQVAEVERALALGATLADVGQGPDVPWVVLADPEGNEFCILRSRS